MTVDEKLFIIILMENKKIAMEILDAIYTMEKKNGAIIFSKAAGMLHTENTTYMIVRPSKSECHGRSADQAITEFGIYNPEIIEELLIKSCVPRSHQVIYSYEILDY